MSNYHNRYRIKIHTSTPELAKIAPDNPPIVNKKIKLKVNNMLLINKIRPPTIVVNLSIQKSNKYF